MAGFFYFIWIIQCKDSLDVILASGNCNLKPRIKNLCIFTKMKLL